MTRKHIFFPLASILAIVVSAIVVQAQELSAYRIFTKDGSPANFGELVQSSTKNQVVLFGELHNNPISHWLQLELTMALFENKNGNIVMGAEMFEADNQLIIDEYFEGLINERNFRSEARLWSNYATDIRPLLEFARENQIRFVATNIPRRYAALVHRQGFSGLEELRDEAKRYIAPLPVAFDEDLPGYKSMLEMSAAHGQINPNFPRAQAIKDATMAHFIMENFKQDHVFLHIHGTYHSNNYEGIVWYLHQKNPTLSLVTIATVEQEDLEVLEDQYLHLADFIIVVPERMTKTH